MFLELHPKHARRFLAGHPWIYANEFSKSDLTKSLEPGSLVQITLPAQVRAGGRGQGRALQDPQDSQVSSVGDPRPIAASVGDPRPVAASVTGSRPVAVGYFNRHSLIAFRALSRHPETITPTDINTEFFKMRLSHAARLRDNIFKEPYYRLVHAEADELPGLIIDRFDEVFILQINTFGMERLKDSIIEALYSLFPVKTLFFQNDTSFRKMEGLEDLTPYFIGEPLHTLQVIENGLSFLIDFSSAQKTGWFFDHRNNRKLISSFAHNKTVIDYFSYSGGFALQAASAGARKVIAVDRSETALKNAENTAKHLRLQDQVQFVCAEAFRDMDQRLSHGEQYDIVILDPPAFIKVKKDIHAGLRGYEKLITKGLQLLNPYGILLIASCSHHATLQDIRECLQRALTKTRRSGQILHTLHAGPDHPIHPFLEESEYLKGFIVATSKKCL